jgi:hypothetical protein
MSAVRTSRWWLRGAPCALLMWAGSAQAQLITGRVVVEGTDAAVNAAAIALLDTLGARRGSSISDSTGSFRIMAPTGGAYRLRVERIGYAMLETTPVHARIGLQVQLELRLSETAVALEPLRVVGRSAFNAGWLQEYYDRAIWTRHAGTGRVFFRDEVEAQRLPHTSSFLMFLMPRGRCRPSLFVDGLPVENADQLDTALRPDLLEGVELYNNPAFIPPRYQNRGHCAVALFWTRRDIERRTPLSWKRILAITGALALITLLTQ